MGRRPPVMLSAAIEAYTGLSSRRAKTKSERTVLKNWRTLNQFRTIICEGLSERSTLDGLPDINIHSVTTQHVSAWEDARSHVRTNTHNSDVSTLRTFFRWTVTTGRWCNAGLPTANLETARAKDAREQVRVTFADWERLYAAARNPRDLFLVKAGLFTGGRTGEIQHVTVGDARKVSPVERTIVYRRFKTDGTKLFYLPLMPELYDAMQEHLGWYQKTLWRQNKTLEDEHMLIPNLTKPKASYDPETGRYIGQVITTIDPWNTPKDPWRIVKGVLTEIGYPTDGAGMHTLRRSFALAMWQELCLKEKAGELEPGQVPIRMVMTMLNHATEKQTWDYIGLTGDQAALNAVVTKGQKFFTHSGKARLASIRSIG